jgi:hypothetical protein
VHFGLEHQALGVYQEVTLPAPDLLVAALYPLCWPPTPVVFVDWESALCPR